MSASRRGPGTSIVPLVAFAAMILVAAILPPLVGPATTIGNSAELGTTVPPSFAHTVVRLANSAAPALVPSSSTAAGGFVVLPDSPRLNCQSPVDPLDDGGANEVFVNCEGSNNVTVISPTNNTVVASIPVGNTFSVSSVEMAYDSGKGEVFVANKNNTNGNTVSVISDKTNAVVATDTVGQNPSGLAYDSGKGEVFVLNANSNDLSVISDTTNAVVATIPVGSGPNDVTYDSGKGEVFVPNWNSGTVSVVSDTTNSVVSTIPVGGWPSQAIYDPAKGELFALNAYSNSVSIISDATNMVATTVPVGTGPADMTYDSGKGEVFVSNFWSSNVSVISDASDSVVGTVPTGPDPAGMTYIPAQSEVFLESIVGGPNASVGRNISVISDSSDRIVASIPEPGTTYGAAYDLGLNELFVPTFPDSVNVISTLNDSVVDTIKVGTLPREYTISFVETGLSPGASWRVAFPYRGGEFWGTSNSSALVFYGQGNETRAYDVSTTEIGVSPTIPSGTVVVQGANVTVDVTFVTAYQAAFSEAGLPTNTSTSWNVTFSGMVLLANGSRVGPFLTTRSSAYGSPLITINLPNGTYAYTAQASGYVSVSGSLSINGSSPPSINIDFKTPGPSGVPVWLLATAIAVSLAVIAVLVVAVRRHRRRRTPLPWASSSAVTTPPRTP
jgi:YVTN family beta-propeller protein